MTWTFVKIRRDLPELPGLVALYRLSKGVRYKDSDRDRLTEYVAVYTVPLGAFSKTFVFPADRKGNLLSDSDLVQGVNHEDALSKLEELS